VFILSSLCVLGVYVRVFCRRLSQQRQRQPHGSSSSTFLIEKVPYPSIEGSSRGLVMRHSHATTWPKQFVGYFRCFWQCCEIFCVTLVARATVPANSTLPLNRRKKFYWRVVEIGWGNAFIFSIVQLGQTFVEICFYYNAITRKLYWLGARTLR